MVKESDVKEFAGFLEFACNGIVIGASHNHPSGNMVASSNDNAIKSKLKKDCELLDITLLDHMILSDTGYLTYADEGMLIPSSRPDRLYGSSSGFPAVPFRSGHSTLRR